LVTVEIFECFSPRRVLYLSTWPACRKCWHPCCTK